MAECPTSHVVRRSRLWGPGPDKRGDRGRRRTGGRIERGGKDESRDQGNGKALAHGGISRRRLEALEPQEEAVPIGIILGTGGHVECPPVQFLERIEHRSVVLTEQTLRNVQAIVGVNPDQVRIERGVMELRER